MITTPTTPEMLSAFKATYNTYKHMLKPNRKTGIQLIRYLDTKYTLTEITSKNALECAAAPVLENECHAEKLPEGETPLPRAFYVENTGKGIALYGNNKAEKELWGGEISKIFVAIDETTGFYTVEGSTLLWDELCAIRGLDERDMKNYVSVAQYIDSLKRFDWLYTLDID